MIKFIKDKWIFIVFVLVVTVILSISGNINQSTSNARYRSEISGDDETRVAKWDVTTISKKDGATLDLEAGFGTTLSTGSTGTWFIEVSNSSEVTAIMGNDSNVRFRLDHNSFSDESPSTMAWNFLYDANTSQPLTNPVQITVTAYKGQSSDLVIKYRKAVNVGGNLTYDVITKAQYDALNAENKADYAEFVDAEGTVIFTTEDKVFKRGAETKAGQLVYFYYLDVDFSGVSEAIKTLEMNNPSSNFTLAVNWVTSNDVGGTGGVSEAEVYNAYELFESTQLPDSYSTLYTEVGRKTINVDGENITYVIAYKKCYFFDYQIFTSGFGGDGEPYFKFPGDYAGSEILVYYSKLFSTNGSLNDYGRDVSTYSKNINGCTTVEELQHVVDVYRYEVHNKFVEDNELFLQSLSYLQYGLTCSIEFDLKIEQKD